MKHLLFLLAVILIVQKDFATAQFLTLDQQTEIKEYISKQVAEDEPGLAYGVVKHGVIILEEYRGIASLQHKVPLGIDSRFNIASVAKQFTALAVLDLILKGKLSLDDDFRNYLPEFYKDVKRPILVRHLINHSSGVRDFYNLMSVQRETWWRQEGLDNGDALELLKKQKDLNFAPGSEFSYSNSNYTIITKLIEVVSGQTFHEYTRSMFDELGMMDTEYNKSYMKVIPNIALPYAKWGGGAWQQYPALTNLFGDGFLYTTLHDQLNFESRVQQATDKGDELLQVSQMPIKDAEITSYGYGLEFQDRLGRKAVHHSGETGAYHAQTVRYLDENLSVVVMSNNSTIRSGFIADKIASILLPKMEVEAIADNQLDESNYNSEFRQSELLGEYKSPEGRIIRIQQNEDQLLWKMDNNNPIQLTKESDNIFYFSYNKNIKLGFSDKQFTVYYPGEDPRVHKKLPAFEPAKNYLHDFTGTYYNSEIDVSFEISMTEKGDIMIFNQDMSKEKMPLEIIQKDELLLYDYILRPNRNAVGSVNELLLTFSSLRNIRFQKIKLADSKRLQYTADGGFIQVNTTADNVGKGNGDILLTKNDAAGNEEWSKLYGGDSYEIASSVLNTSDSGYLIIGSTSSFGNGNYDVWIIKVDKDGNKQWSTPYGGVENEYGFQAIELREGDFKILTSKVMDWNADSSKEIVSITKKGVVKK